MYGGVEGGSGFKVFICVLVEDCEGVVWVGIMGWGFYCYELGVWCFEV